MEGITAYPLKWPFGWKRNEFPEWSRFGDHSFAKVRDKLIHEVDLLGGENLIISSNLSLKQDGFPYSGQAQPKDPGIAVYFQLKGRPIAMPCDAWDKTHHNLWAIVKHIEAMRGQNRWGVGTVDRAFEGYKALPQSTSVRSCWEILGLDLSKNPSAENVKSAYRELAKKHHTDKGGDLDMWNSINDAYKQCMAVTNA